MIEKTLKTGDGKLKVRIPTILNEITLGQMMEMYERHYMDDLDAISILSGITKEELYTVTNFDDFQVFGDYVQSLAHQIKYLYNSEIVPHKVTFMLGKRKVSINVIRNLSVEPAGAFLAARNIIADEINEHIDLYGEDGWKEHFQPSLKACCNVLAQYFFCRATGKKYDEYEAEEFADEIKKLWVTEALPIAKHFFSCYPDLLKQKIGFFQRLHQYWRRKRVYRRLKNLNTSTP
ncbi:hypothetical protein ACPPVU_11865 [Mucilaginibacter sp. McL0603]|uniref:hypothetical protein n=1 Tax=Mucilaginibacter sp. McL0603 TaxID=3415670 RepID=UPI003CFB1BC0